MKKFFFTSVLLSSALFSSLAAADFHSLTIGYAQSEIQHYDDVNGVSFKYRYEMDESRLGLISSFNWMEGKSRDVQFKRYSWMAGPAWRVSNVVSVYALGGMSWNRARYDYYSRDSDSAFAWGLGVQFNPQPNIVLEAGYQGGKLLEAQTHGFTIGAGYRF